MSLYERVVQSLSDFKTVSSHITSLGKLRNSSEDTRLNQALDVLIKELQRFHTSSKSKSTPTSLAAGTSTEVKNVLTYCQGFIANKKPEWQVIAERHGWTPPPA